LRTARWQLLLDLDERVDVWRRLGVGQLALVGLGQVWDVVDEVWVASTSDGTVSASFAVSASPAVLAVSEVSVVLVGGSTSPPQAPRLRVAKTARRVSRIRFIFASLSSETVRFGALMGQRSTRRKRRGWASW